MHQIEQLQAWYAAQCNGKWEHTYGIAIGTLDNPGWSLSVDLDYQNYHQQKEHYLGGVA